MCNLNHWKSSSGSVLLQNAYMGNNDSYIFSKDNLWIWRWACALNFFGQPWRGPLWVEPALLYRCMVLATVLIFMWSNNSHLRPCITNESHDAREGKWLIGPNLDIFTKVCTHFCCDINGCVLSYFKGTANVHCYTSCTLTTLHCSKVSFLQCCPIKKHNKIFTKMWGLYSLLWDTVSGQ